MMRFLLAITIVALLSGRALAEDVATTDPCDSREAKLLAKDAKRATQWNWGWGGLYSVATIAQSTLALTTDDDDFRVAMWTGAGKAGIGVLNQIIFPKRIYAPGPGCKDLVKKLRQARRTEHWGHNWFAHGSVVAANVAGFAVVAGLTENYVLATTGTIVGSIVGEIAIYTSPNALRAAGLGPDTIGLVPQLRAGYSGLALQGTF